MSDWQVGDLAVCVGGDPTRPGYWVCDGAPKKGAVIPVADVHRAPWGTWVALCFAGYQSPHYTRGWDSRSFRKIRPDQHEACEPEFVTLLKRSKRKVDA